MPIFTLELLFRGDSGQKSHWEGVAKELQEKGARILKIQSKVGLKSPLGSSYTFGTGLILWHIKPSTTGIY